MKLRSRVVGESSSPRRKRPAAAAQAKKRGKRESAEAAAPSPAHVEPENPLAAVWARVESLLHEGMARELFKRCKIRPPATDAEIASLCADLGFALGDYEHLLRLANGVQFYFDGSSEVGSSPMVSFCFGGTGDREEDVSFAFHYSGEYGVGLFRRRRQIPYQMLDYDFCVNVFRTRTGALVQDDRECCVVRPLHPSLSAWLEQVATELETTLQKHFSGPLTKAAK
jgi:hypothetical protein